MTINDKIKQDLTSNNILLYMKGLPGNSACGYSTRVVAILNHIGLLFETRDVLESDELRSGVKAYANVRTLPLLFVKGNYVGGSDDIKAMHEAGNLVAFFENLGVPVAIDPSRGKLVVDDISREKLIKCSKAS